MTLRAPDLLLPLLRQRRGGEPGSVGKIASPSPQPSPLRGKRETRKANLQRIALLAFAGRQGRVARAAEHLQAL